MPARLHRIPRKRDRKAYLTAYNAERPQRERGQRPEGYKRIIGIDGEGQGRGPHLYTYLAASDESGQARDVADPAGLSSRACLEFLVSLPQNALIFGFAFGYDLTKILKDLPPDLIYKLVHEQTRLYMLPSGRTAFRPIMWEGFKINYLNKRLSIKLGKRSCVIWDIFRFFQCKFTKAVQDWGILGPEELAVMARMKDRRAEFDKLGPAEIQAYCRSECKALASLARAIINAHEAAGLHLQTYFGVGSTATALLRKLGIEKTEPPEPMRQAIASAFFGGRFENSRIGPVPGLIYGYDIASAYPYHTARLPCLECGSWELRKGRGLESAIDRARLALVHYDQPKPRGRLDWAWGPLPWRSPDGTILFPVSSGGGWTWREEYREAREGWPNVRATEAWCYKQECDHAPFAELPQMYRERVRLGKDGKGVVLKLAMNATYGKLAQSKGKAPFQSWIYAGCITSGTRAQLLRAIRQAADPWSILMFATDGIWTTAPLKLPLPEETGTGDLPKPLGFWEEKTFSRGVFCVRPGIYFPLEPTEDMLKEVRARGLGKKILYDQWRAILETWNRTQYHEPLVINGIQRFISAKQGLRYSKKKGYTRSPTYGEWEPYPVVVSFDPKPKREDVLSDQRLTVWEHAPGASTPYDAATISAEVAMLREAQSIAEDQPDADWVNDGF